MDARPFRRATLLPRSGLPPQRHGNMVFLRDEGCAKEVGKRLWWLTMGEQSHLSALDDDVGAVGEVILGRDGFVFLLRDGSGDLWACVGGASLLRRSQDGHYSIAILNGSVEFTEDLLGPRKTNQGLSDFRRHGLARRYPASRRRHGALSAQGQRVGARTRLHG